MPSPADSETQSLSRNLSVRPSLAVGAHLSPGEISSQNRCFQQKAESIVYFRMTAVALTVQGSFTFPAKNRTTCFLEGAPSRQSNHTLSEELTRCPRPPPPQGPECPLSPRGRRGHQEACCSRAVPGQHAAARAPFWWMSRFCASGEDFSSVVSSRAFLLMSGISEGLRVFPEPSASPRRSVPQLTALSAQFSPNRSQPPPASTASFSHVSSIHCGSNEYSGLQIVALLPWFFFRARNSSSFSYNFLIISSRAHVLWKQCSN